jgi:hypothetical protein
VESLYEERVYAQLLNNCKSWCLIPTTK